MNYSERNQIYQSTNFIAQCRIALCDWLEYWATNGTETIEDEELRRKTDMFINLAISMLETYVSRVAVLVISNSNLKSTEEITDNIVKSAVDSVMSKSLDYLIFPENV